jgi:hypothetical protein
MELLMSVGSALLCRSEGPNLSPGYEISDDSLALSQTESKGLPAAQSRSNDSIREEKMFDVACAVSTNAFFTL